MRRARKPRWMPYVNDPDMPAGDADALKLRNPQDNFKTYDQRCATCGAPDSPFGVGFPDNTKWYCRKHAEGRMTLDGEIQLRYVKTDTGIVDPSGQGVAGHVLSGYPERRSGDAGGLRGTEGTDPQDGGRPAFTPIKLDWSTLQPPGCVCRDSERASTGVGYSDGTSFYCRDHLPDEYDERKIQASWRKR